MEHKSALSKSKLTKQTERGTIIAVEKQKTIKIYMHTLIVTFTPTQGKVYPIVPSSGPTSDVHFHHH